MVALAGFHIKRQEFEPEYDNEAEMIVADMEFKEDDTEVRHHRAPRAVPKVHLWAVRGISISHCIPIISCMHDISVWGNQVA